MEIKQTAGRDQLGEFAPTFAALNDDVLFGQVWSRDELPLKQRSIIMVTALLAQGLVDESFRYHLMSARNNGVSKQEIAELITHVAFYTGWPKAWAAFRLSKEVWVGTEGASLSKQAYEQQAMFPVGEPNDAYAQYFTGQSYLAEISSEQVVMHNVTFEPGCRNNWHIHHAATGGGQQLICVGGRGWYQEEGKPARALAPGDVVNIPANVKHWHGAASDSWFSHLAIAVEGTETSNEWLEPVTDEEYAAIETAVEKA